MKQPPSENVYLARSYELAGRGLGGTPPNPPVGAVIVRDGHTLGEGFHHAAGAAHAEVEALRAAADVRGATMYVSLEPCNHQGRTGPCTAALIAAGIARVVIGTLDPNPTTSGGGVAALRAAGIAVAVVDDPAARALIEPFAFAIRSERPYIALKMASSLDGCSAPAPGTFWLTGAEAGVFVRDLRIRHDAVMVGAGTVRIDDPQLTVRPPHARPRAYTRIVVCETDTVDPERRVFEPIEGTRTLVLAPAGLRERFAPLENIATVVYAGEDRSTQLDLRLAMQALRAHDVTSVLCEGGPTLAGRLLEADLVDRFYWLIAPVFLRNERALPVLAGSDVSRLAQGGRYDRVERLGNDVLLSGSLR